AVLVPRLLDRLLIAEPFRRGVGRPGAGAGARTSALAARDHLLRLDRPMPRSQRLVRDVPKSRDLVDGLDLRFDAAAREEPPVDRAQDLAHARLGDPELGADLRQGPAGAAKLPGPGGAIGGAMVHGAGHELNLMRLSFGAPGVGSGASDTD